MRSTFGISVSLCQTMTGSTPSARSRATFTSRSQLEAGKTMTAAFIQHLPHEVDRVILDDRIGEKLSAHRLDVGARLARIGLGKLDLDVFALAHTIDALEAE